MKTVNVNLNEFQLLRLIQACNRRAQDFADVGYTGLAKEYDALSTRLQVSMNVLANLPENATGGEK